MCGIFGWYLNTESGFAEEHLTSMQDRLAHRGPDSKGTLVDSSDGLALGHNRLSIIDVSDNAKQPMRNPKSGNVLTFNGEIYNFKLVRHNLESLGYTFNSSSDTEVLLYALEEWGLDCLSRIEGMFAFAYWQKNTKTMFLVRDPMGVKPLYYWPSNKGLVFSSEVKGFFDLPGFDKEVNLQSLSQVLDFGYAIDNENTIFNGIKKLGPGQIITCKTPRDFCVETYFNPSVETGSKYSSKDYEEELFKVLTEVVEQQLISDVPVGLLLSGGLDSSILASLAAKTISLNTIGFGFSDSSIDERSKSKAVSEFIGSNHEEFEISPNDVMLDLEKTAGVMDDFFTDWGVFSTRAMYKKCRERGIKVVIVGEGADELFGGYWKRFSHSLTSVNSWNIDFKLFQMYRRYIGRRYGANFSTFRSIMKSHLKRTDGDLFSAIRLFETKEQLSNNFIMKVDKACMAESVEARVPYLDSRVAELAYKIPRDFLIGQNHETKKVLTNMARRFNLLPESILQQKKFGIGLPPEWVYKSSDFRKYSEEVILDKSGWTYSLGMDKVMIDYFKNGKSGSRFPGAISIYGNLAWKLLILNLWSRALQVSP